jgi:YfiH family protein
MMQRGDRGLQTEPRRRAGFVTWTFENDLTHISFVGKGPDGSRSVAYRALTDDPERRLAWPRQIHSSRVVAVDDGGESGKADALTTEADRLALSVATADCVPIVVAGTQTLATIHAGWRGLVGGVITNTVGALAEPSAALRAWIGPAIGSCCYEVGNEVARQVVAASAGTVRHETSLRPHLDLTAAAEVQLRRAGIEQIEAIRVCTRCHPEWLWSYRLDRERAGRNWTFAWRR